MDLSPLLEPYQIGGAVLPNRFAMAPMTRRFSPDGVPGDDVVAYYSRRAARGVGLIITEGTYIDHPSAGDQPRVPLFYGAGPLAGWRRVVDAVHEAGGRIFPQLWHVGSQRGPDEHDRERAEILSPSGVDNAGQPVGRAMTQADIDATIAAYARSAAAAKEIGCDGIEVHAAHGYLIDQFMWQFTNRRDDQYGGSLSNRARFGAEVVRAIRAAVGPDFPVVYRYSQWKVDDYEARTANDAEELAALLGPVAAEGVSVFHASTRRFWVPPFEGSGRTLAGWIKHLTGVPTMAVGNLGLEDASGGGTYGSAVAPQLERLLQLHAEGEFDLVAIGRALIVNHDWVDLVRNGRADQLVPFTAARQPVLF